MKKYLLMLFTCLCYLGHPEGAYARKEFNHQSARNFGDGEKLQFRVYYNMGFVWINAGNVTMDVSDQTYRGQKSLHITGYGKTAKSYEWFFKVTDKYETYLDPETLLPEKFIRDVDEGGVKFKNDVTFFQTRGFAVSDTSLYKIPDNTQDILSSLYFARTLDFAHLRVGDKVPFNVFLDNKVYKLTLRFDGKEKIVTKMGEYNALRLVPQVIKGAIFKDEDKLTIWVSDDDNHVPLRVSSPILVGSIKIDLVGYNNLSNPFSSMLHEY